MNNAGISGGAARVDEVAPQAVADVLATNVAGPFLCCGAAVRRMSTRHGGSGGAIVNISSRAAVLGSPGEWVHYAASKAAVDTLTVGLAQEVATEGVRVNAIAVGLVDTEFHESSGEADRPGPHPSDGPDEALGHARGGRGRRGVAALGRRVVHDRDRPRRERRPLTRAGRRRN